MGAAFIGTEFVGERLPLDGIEYNGCRFDRCTLVYAGGELPKLIDCEMTDTPFAFEGPAARTVEFLQAITNVPGGDLIIRATFPKLFRSTLS